MTEASLLLGLIQSLSPERQIALYNFLDSMEGLRLLAGLNQPIGRDPEGYFQQIQPRIAFRVVSNNPRQTYKPITSEDASRPMHYWELCTECRAYVRAILMSHRENDGDIQLKKVANIFGLSEERLRHWRQEHNKKRGHRLPAPHEMLRIVIAAAGIDPTTDTGPSTE